MVDETIERTQASGEDGPLAQLRADLGGKSYQRSLDGDHIVTYLARGPRLLVTFETLQTGIGDDQPLGLDFVEDKNWSLLHFASHTPRWFRAGPVYEAFDDLVDDAFFEEFDQVTFYGAGFGAYAACAYSVAAPGASVLAIAPQATLDTTRAGWDRRFNTARRLRFDDRYGYAPDMLEGARAAFVLYDPHLTLDHAHASLFRGPNMTRLKCRYLGDQIERALREMDLLHRFVEMAANHTLNEAEFYPIMRARRNHGHYLQALTQAAADQGQPLRVALLCQYALKTKRGDKFFRSQLTAARQTLAEIGPLPDWLAPDDPA